MLLLVSSAAKKHSSQRVLSRNLISKLRYLGLRNVGYPGGNVDTKVWGNGDGKLWYARPPWRVTSTKNRILNSFGVLQQDAASQLITVEINIPLGDNRLTVGGFFAQDVETGDTFLMHTGKIGGGQIGIGKKAFLISSRVNLEDVVEEGGGVREGIPICNIKSLDIENRIFSFVRLVHAFKKAASEGQMNTDGFKQKNEENDRYNEEFSGRKRGHHAGDLNYFTYHGDIVDKLYRLRQATRQEDEEVFNTQLIDLFVKRSGTMIEIYEVKTSLDRQVLYTAIGQLMTHGTTPGGFPKKFLVIPDADLLPNGFKAATAALDITIIGFRILRQGARVNVRISL